MFEGITESLTGALSFFTKGRLTERNIEEGLRAVKQALLEADVNYAVAQQFVDRVAQQAIGAQVLKSINPSQQFIGILHQELVQLMGPVDHSLHLTPGRVTVLMLCGLQGSGKTTTCGKLAKRLLEEGQKPMLVAADLQRPAAIEQLKIIGQQLGVPVYSEAPGPGVNAVRVCESGVREGERNGDVSVVILDTAGRLHVDDELMRELEQIDRRLSPHQILLVCDAMTGQDAVNSAKAFNDALELDGVILTKLDGDARGGAALSVKAVTGVPIKFIGVGEQLDRLELFHPDRMASRVLGMGDVVSLFEKAQQQFDREEMEAQQKKLAEGKFSLTDFRDQMTQVRKMGTMRDLLKMIPGMGKISEMLGSDFDPEEGLSQINGIIDSMTPAEREDPEIIDISRRRRIAEGSGVDPSDVNQLLKQFTQMAGVMKNIAGLGMRDRLRAVSQLAESGMLNPGASLQLSKQRSKRGPEDKREFQDKRKKQRKEAKKQRKKNKR